MGAKTLVWRDWLRRTDEFSIELVRPPGCAFDGPPSLRGRSFSVEEFHPRATHATGRFSLADARLVTARSYGFASWTKLKQHLIAIGPFIWNPASLPDPKSPADVFVRLACLTYAGWHRSNPAKALRMVADDPELAHANIHTAAAVGDVAAVRKMLDSSPALVKTKGAPLSERRDLLDEAPQEALDTPWRVQLPNADSGVGPESGRGEPFRCKSGSGGR